MRAAFKRRAGGLCLGIFCQADICKYERREVGGDGRALPLPAEMRHEWSVRRVTVGMNILIHFTRQCLIKLLRIKYYF